eukprot:Lithocolla_globosa_v1_NODE_7446_length_946_cov_34.950617.p2 type:complete len:124 gc:universal NODE_7446_length_946_cov_34.950617:831-460(-)
MKKRDLIGQNSINKKIRGYHVIFVEGFSIKTRDTQRKRKWSIKRWQTQEHGVPACLNVSMTLTLVFVVFAVSRVWLQEILLNLMVKIIVVSVSTLVVYLRTVYKLLPNSTSETALIPIARFFA